MAADVAKFSAAIDKVWKTFSTQEVLDRRELKELAERDIVQYVDQRFQEHLQRARGAFLQEFRNHSVVVESEVRKIRAELTEQLEQEYGEKIAHWKNQSEQSFALLSKRAEEIAQLKSLTIAQETYISAVRHRLSCEQTEKLQNEIRELNVELQRAKRDGAELSHELVCSDELVSLLREEVDMSAAELDSQKREWQEEQRVAEERHSSTLFEMDLQLEACNDERERQDKRFAEHREQTSRELQVQEILNARRSQALALMEEEREMHTLARTKPSPRIGPDGDKPYSLAKNSRYRVDHMGMSTSWREYELTERQGGAASRKPKVPKFRVDRHRHVNVPVGPNAPMMTENLLPVVDQGRSASVDPTMFRGSTVLGLPLQSR